MKKLGRAASVIVAVAALAGSSSVSRAQTAEYPSKRVRIFVGAAPGDVLAGHVDLMFISMVTGSAQVKAGKLKAFSFGQLLI